MIVYGWPIAAGIQALIISVPTYQFARNKSALNKLIPKIFVIIAARNERQNLQQLVLRLLGRHCPDFEIVIAPDRCSDDSPGYLQLLKENKIRIVNLPDVPFGFNPDYAIGFVMKL